MTNPPTTVDPIDERAAKKQRQFHSARDFETSASQIGDVDPLQDDTRRKMQLIIAGNAKGRSKKDRLADATELMMMLGVHPSQPADTDPLSAPIPGFNLRGGHN